MNELRGKIAFATIHLMVISKEMEAAAIADATVGEVVDWNERYQQMMGWAMGIKSYAEFLDKIEIDDGNKDSHKE